MGTRELHDLGGLEADEAEVEPALRALADVAHDVHHDQQHHAGDVQREGAALRSCCGRTCASATIATAPMPRRATARSTMLQFWPEALYSTIEAIAGTRGPGPPAADHPAAAPTAARAAVPSVRRVVESGRVRGSCRWPHHGGGRASLLQRPVPHSAAAPPRARARLSSAAAAGRRPSSCARWARRRLAPKPPFSTSTATAICGSSAGAKAMNQAWSRRFSSTLRVQALVLRHRIRLRGAGLAGDVVFGRGGDGLGGAADHGLRACLP